MPKKAFQRPTEGELTILRVLWDRGPSTVRQVHEALGGDKRTGYTTTLKLMQIMAAKGLVRRQASGMAHIYTHGVNEQVTQRRLVGELIDKAFGGSARKLILQALSARRTTDKELEAVKRLLDEQGGERR